MASTLHWPAIPVGGAPSPRWSAPRIGSQSARGRASHTPPRPGLQQVSAFPRYPVGGAPPPRLPAPRIGPQSPRGRASHNPRPGLQQVFAFPRYPVGGAPPPRLPAPRIGPQSARGRGSMAVAALAAYRHGLPLAGAPTTPTLAFSKFPRSCRVPAAYLWEGRPRRDCPHRAPVRNRPEGGPPTTPPVSRKPLRFR